VNSRQHRQQLLLDHTRLLLAEQQDDDSNNSVSIAIDPKSDYAQAILLEHLGLTERQQDQVELYCSLILEWNQKINLVSRKECTPEVIFGRHILPCLSPILLPEITIKDGDTVIDVGTGAGFPGIPMAILYPHANFLLVDSVHKKLKAVQDMVERLGLENVQILHSRAEDITPPGDGFDWCVGRSVASLPKFCAWMQHLLKPESGRLLYIIGGHVPESTMAEADHSIHDLLTTTNHEIPLPDGLPIVSEKRILIFPQTAVQAMASSSGVKTTVASSSTSNKKKNPNLSNKKQKKPRASKGAWQKKRDDQKKRGYEEFQRYSSNTPE
jgi:16S rRNA (guanine527-N7)-methyltransferase